MNLFKKIRESKEKNDDDKELVLEGIEDDMVPYVVSNMLEKCMQDIYENYGYGIVDPQKEYNISLYYEECDRCNHWGFRVGAPGKYIYLKHSIEEEYEPKTGDDILHRPLNVTNLSDDEIKFLLANIFDVFKSYGIEFKKSKFYDNDADKTRLKKKQELKFLDVLMQIQRLLN